MLSKSSLALRVGAFVFVLGCIGTTTWAGDAGQLRVKARIAGQSYCRADANLFTVSVKLEIEILNASKNPVEVKSSMVPWIAKIAANTAEANAGHFLFEITQSHYPQHDTKPSDTVRIEPGKSVTLRTGYDFVGRYDPEFSYPKSISAGTYAIVLVLKPEMELPREDKSVNVVEALTTEPFLLEIRKNPHIVDCGGQPRK